MGLLVLGLVLMLGVHSVGIVAPQWREAQRQRLGMGRWKILYSLASLIGLGLVIWGFSNARAEPVVLWTVPHGMNHLAVAVMLPVFILLAASRPGTRIKAWTGHPMLLATALWATVHLLANATLADQVLFGSFLAWSGTLFLLSRQRDQSAGTTYPAAGWKADIIAVVIGAVVWIVFLLRAHEWLIGVRPLG